MQIVDHVHQVQLPFSAHQPQSSNPTYYTRAFHEKAKTNTTKDSKFIKGQYHYTM